MTIFNAAALPTGDESSLETPVFGPSMLNHRGLHVACIRLMERVADRRRERPTRFAGSADREACACDGFIVRRDALPATEFSALNCEIDGRPFEAWEMRRGSAMTSSIHPPPDVLCDAAAEDGLFVYVPGSHRMTVARLAWEPAQSETWAAASDRHHAAVARGRNRLEPRRALWVGRLGSGPAAEHAT